MFILKNLIIAISKILEIAVNIGLLVIILDVVFSWVNASTYNRIVHSVMVMSDFIMRPLKKRFNLIVGVIDFAPIVTIMILYFIKNFVIQSLIDIAVRL
jgi:YggT family protein